MPEKALCIINRAVIGFFFISCTVLILDKLFFADYVHRLLPQNITELSWYYIIFGLPHIIASFVSYANKEYIAYYKKDIIKGALISISILVCFFLFAPGLLIYFFIGYTMYHVAWQQLGLCKKYICEHNANLFLYKVWSISGVVAATALALSVGGESLVYIPQTLYMLLQFLGIIALSIFIFATIRMRARHEYVSTTAYIILLSAIAILSHYYILGILMLRIMHDVTAYSIYSKHDSLFVKKSRADNKSKNYIYSFFRINPYYIAIFLLCLSIAVAYLLQKQSSSIFIAIILVLSLMHYYLEGVAWRRGTVHRNTLHFG